MKSIISIIIVPALVFLMLLLLYTHLPDEFNNIPLKANRIIPVKSYSASVELSLPREETLVLDTLFTSCNSFIEINMKTQMARQYYRDGSFFEFGVSTGTKAIEEGQTTNEGLYMVQLMVDSKYSDKFTDALLINWMAYNYGIGLHGLVGNGYYRYLGVRPSSHGCVRVARENIKKVFDRSVVGTPVLVHSENNAIWVGFADSVSDYTSYSYYQLKSLLPERQEALYEGEYFYRCSEKILLTKKSFSNSGLPIGRRDRIPDTQRPVLVIPFQTIAAERDVLEIFLPAELDTSLLASN